MTTPTQDDVTVPILRMHPAVPRLGEGGTRRKPYVLRGREEEFTHLAAAIPNEDAPVYVIEGPPGTGKTALADAVGAYAGRCGYTVVKFDASTLGNAYQVAHQIWTQFDAAGRPHPQPDQNEFGLNFGLAHYKNKLGNTEYDASMELLNNMYQCYQMQNNEQHRTRGFVIIIDNAATWRSALDESNPKHDPLKGLCNTLNDMVYQMEPKIPILTIFAGTPGTVKTIQKLTSNRLENTQYFLQGIRTAAIEEIIQDHLLLYDADGSTILTPDCLSTDSIIHVAHECHHNVWHATAIGRKLQRHCIRNPSYPISPSEVQECIDDGQLEVYSDMYKRLEKNDHRTLAYIAAAAQQRDNRLDVHSTEQLLSHANDELRTNSDIETFIHTGIIELRERVNRYAHHNKGRPAANHYTITIPSFAHFIQDMISDVDHQRERTVTEHLQTMPHVAPWHWYEADELMPIEPMPEDYAGHFVPGQAAALYPPIPGNGRP